MFYKQDVMIQIPAVLFKYKKKLSVTGMVSGRYNKEDKFNYWEVIKCLISDQGKGC